MAFPGGFRDQSFDYFGDPPHVFIFQANLSGPRPPPPPPHWILLKFSVQPRPQGFSLKKWVGLEEALASAGHVYRLNIPEKLIYMQPAGFVLTEVEGINRKYE